VSPDSPTDDELDLAARRLVAGAELDDPVVTDLVRAAAAEAGGAIVGLDNRIKELASVKRKLSDAIGINPDKTLADAAEGLYDVLRYTVVSDADRYMAVREAVLIALQQRDARVVEERNRWTGPGYRGINVRLVIQGHGRFEIQFHTPESYAANKATRGQYEERRLETTSPERRDQLDVTIDAAFDVVPIPPGAVP
jgi:hypothetical protein